VAGPITAGTPGRLLGGPSALALAELTQVVGGRAALRRVSLAVPAGAALGLVGPNGSGKSTLLRVAATLLRPTAGTVWVLGYDVRTDAAAARRKLGYVPESAGVYPLLSVAEHLELFARLRGVPAAERGETVKALLEIVGLERYRHVEATNLSRGLRRRLLLALALVHGPELLLLDEPLDGLDAVGRLELLEVLREQHAMGTTLVIASNDLSALETLCTGIAELRHGELVRAGPAAELLAASPAAGRRIRAEVLGAPEAALAALRAIPQVQELEARGQTLTFRLSGDGTLQAEVLGRLVAAGLAVTRFGPADEPLADLWLDGGAVSGEERS
jgi:ABC-2 type transport system ATP-binding protein